MAETTHSHCCCDTRKGCQHAEHDSGHHHHDHDHEHGSLRSQIVLIAVTILLLIAAVVIEKTCHLAPWQLLLVYLVPYLLIGHDTLRASSAATCSMSTS